MASNATKSTPKDAQVMAAILKDMGIVEYEPRVINQMLEFSYRYVTDVLDDAKVYSQHANKKNIDLEDVKLAVQCKTDHSFTNPPPKDLLQEIARQKNSQPLPPIKPYGGPRLLPDRYCLTAPNYRSKTSRKPTQPTRIQFGLPTQRISLSSASKGKSISNTTGQSITMVPKPSSSGLSTGQVTIISKPVTTVTAKPTIRINTGPAAAGIGASGLSHIMTQSTPSTSAVASTSLISSASISGTPTSLLGLGQTITVNPLKRKLEDNEYDV